MPDPITLSNNDVYLTGRTKAPDPMIERVGVAARVDFRQPNTFVVDFTVTNQAAVIGTVRAMFMDNTSNPNEVVVAVSSTNQSFTIPPFAEGYFPITATESSRITLTSLGGAAVMQSAVFYNYEIPPQVWYKYGMDPNGGILKAQGSQPSGTNMDAAPYNNPVYIGGRKPDATLSPFSLAATGEQLVLLGDGKDVSQGALADVAWNGAGNGSVISILKAIYNEFLLSATGAFVQLRAGAVALIGERSSTDARASSATDNALLVVNRGTILNSAGTFDRARSVTGSNNSQGLGAAAVGLPLWNTADVTQTPFTTAAAGDTVLVAAVAGQTTRVYSIRFTVAAAVTVQIKRGATVVESFLLGANGSVTLDLRDRPYYKTAANEALNINLSSAVNTTGVVEYVTSA